MRLLQLITLDDSVFAIVITAAEQVVFTVFTRICLLAGLLKVKVTRGQEVKIVFLRMPPIKIVVEIRHKKMKISLFNI